MSENIVKPDLKRLSMLKRMKEGEQLYVLISGCTRNPYVVCDPETYDDCIEMLFDEEMAKTELKRFQELGKPISLAKVVKTQRLVFYTSLYTMGVNAILIREKGQDTVIQLEEVVKRMDPSQQKEGSVWIENPQLHLTALYFMQNLRSSKEMEMTPELLELQEEISADFGKGRFLVPIQKEGKGVPLIKMGNGEKYQPVFTDILEFQKFNRSNTLKPVIVPAEKISQALVSEACGVVLNPMGVNMPLKLGKNKPAKESQ